MTALLSGDPIVGILLAAGSASRFGGDKLLAPLEDGTPLGVRALINLAACVDRVVAVVRPGDQALARALSGQGAEVTFCTYAALGMGQSLAWAIRATPLAKVWVVALADMPGIRSRQCGVSSTHRLRFRAGSCLAPGRAGHPVGFRGVTGELAAFRRRGAKAIVLAHNGS